MKLINNRDSILKKIDTLRKQLEDSIISNYFITNEQIVELSQKLDIMIVEYYK